MAAAGVKSFQKSRLHGYVGSDRPHKSENVTDVTDVTELRFRKKALQFKVFSLL